MPAAATGRRRAAAAAILAALAGAWGCSHGARFEPYPEAEVMGHRNAHEFRGKPLCQACHLPGNGLKAEPVAVCGHCHDPGHLNHPLGVAMKEKPEGLPLWDGRIVCHTCHDPHDVKRNRAGLRLAAGDLCLRCHRRHGSPPGHGTARATRGG